MSARQHTGIDPFALKLLADAPLEPSRRDDYERAKRPSAFKAPSEPTPESGIRGGALCRVGLLDFD